MTVQLPLFGSQYVHLALSGTCLMCGVLLAMAEVYDDCGSCPGLVEPAPPWALLGDSRGTAEALPFAASLEAGWAA